MYYTIFYTKLVHIEINLNYVLPGTDSVFIVILLSNFNIAIMEKTSAFEKIVSRSQKIAANYHRCIRLRLPTNIRVLM